MAYRATVHSGPAGLSGVIPKHEPKASSDISKIEITPAHNGGYVVHEYYKGGHGMISPEPKVHACKDLTHLDQVLDDCLGMSSHYEAKAHAASAAKGGGKGKPKGAAAEEPEEEAGAEEEPEDGGDEGEDGEPEGEGPGGEEEEPEEE